MLDLINKCKSFVELVKTEEDIIKKTSDSLLNRMFLNLD